VKLYNNVVIALFLIAGTLHHQSCGGNPGMTQEEKFLSMLCRKWKLAGVKCDGERTYRGQDLTGMFNTMRVQFDSNMTYTVTHPKGRMWPGSGTYSLVGDDDIWSIIRDDGVEIVILNLTAEEFIFSVQFEDDTLGRDSISGQYQFYLVAVN